MWRRALSMRPILDYGSLSSAASRLIAPPAVTVIVRCHSLKPDLPMEIVCSPGVNCTVEGVVPTNLPSMVISAPSGVDLITTADAVADASGFDVPDSTIPDWLLNLVGSKGVSAAI